MSFCFSANDLFKFKIFPVSLRIFLELQPDVAGPASGLAGHGGGIGEGDGIDRFFEVNANTFIKNGLLQNPDHAVF